MVNKSNPDNNNLRTWSHINLRKHAQNYERRVLFSIISVFVLSTVFVLTNAYPTGNAHAQLYPFIASTRGSFDVSNGNDTQKVELPSADSCLPAGRSRRGASFPQRPRQSGRAEARRDADGHSPGSASP